MYLCIDIGGSKIILAATEKDGTIVERKQVATPKKYEDFIPALRQEVEGLEHQDFELAVIAVPGLMDHDTDIGLGFGSLRWVNVPIGPDIKSFMRCPVLFENDTRIAALAAAAQLPEKHRSVFYITISNGIGGGLIYEGRIVPAMRDSEFGSIVFPRGNELIRWEDFISGRSIFERFGKKMSEITDEATLKTIGEDLAIGVIACIAGVQADIVVFGGGAGAHLDKVLPYIEQYFDEHLFPAVKRPKLAISKNPEEVVLMGCYQLALLGA